MPALLSERHEYIQEWVRVFYATLFVGEDRKYIVFMFNKNQYRLNRQSLARYLGVTLLEEEPYSLHFHTYGDADPPHRLKEPMFPSNEDVSVLFQPPFLPGTPRVPSRLTLVAYVIHFALKRSLLFRIGYSEGITAIQLWLLVYILGGLLFDIVNFFICELEDVIMEGLTSSRRQPYAHWISWILAQLDQGAC